MTPLSSLKPGESALIARLPADEHLASRLREMGLLTKTSITFVRCAPLGDPMEYRLRGFELSIRKADAAQVMVSKESLSVEKRTRSPKGAVVGPPVFIRTEASIPPMLQEGEGFEVRCKSYAVVGNPNSGKTTLFNALTGLRQKVGNYPGVTVEKKLGQFIGQHGEKIELLDLPGSYSLGAHAPDERVTRDVLFGLRQDTPRPERVLCVVDASHLERNLYFITQVLELGLPTIIALNMIDVAEAQGVPINAAKLSGELGVPVIPVQATRKESMLPLRLALSRAEVPKSNWKLELPSIWTRATDGVAALWPGGGASDPRPPRDPFIRMKAALLLAAPDAEIPSLAEEMGAGRALGVAMAQRIMLDRDLPEWREALVSTRYAHIGELCHAAQGGRSAASDLLTHHLDNLLTHRYWGWLCFVGMMTLMFVSIFTIAQYPMEWINAGFDKLAEGVQGILPAGDPRDRVGLQGEGRSVSMGNPLFPCSVPMPAPFPASCPRGQSRIPRIASSPFSWLR